MVLGGGFDCMVLVGCIGLLGDDDSPSPHHPGKEKGKMVRLVVGILRCVV